MASGTFRYVVQCFDSQSPEGMRFSVCTVDVFADSEAEAVERAKALISKPFQAVVTVIEQEQKEPLLGLLSVTDGANQHEGA